MLWTAEKRLAYTYFGAATCYFDFIAPLCHIDYFNRKPWSHSSAIFLKSPKLFSHCLYGSHSVFLIIHCHPSMHFFLFCLTFFYFFRWQHKQVWERQNRSRIALENTLQSQLIVLMSVCWTSAGQRCYWTKQSLHSR